MVTKKRIELWNYYFFHLLILLSPLMPYVLILDVCWVLICSKSISTAKAIFSKSNYLTRWKAVLPHIDIALLRKLLWQVYKHVCFFKRCQNSERDKPWIIISPQTFMKNAICSRWSEWVSNHSLNFQAAWLFHKLRYRSSTIVECVQQKWQGAIWAFAIQNKTKITSYIPPPKFLKPL